MERQEEDARKLAQRLDLDVLEVFVDNDISAYSGKLRPAYRALLSRLAHDDFDSVICWHTDRLHRSPKELEEYIDVSEKHGVTTHSVQSGELDLSTASGRAVARTLGAWARFESEQKSDRIRRAKQQARESGTWAGGRVPYGWTVVDGVVSVNEEEARWVRLATQKILEGASLRSTVAHLTAQNAKTSTGAAWASPTLRGILLRAKNASLRQVGDDYVPQPLFPALVTEDAWHGVRAILTDDSRVTHRGNASKWLLTSVAYCECGETVEIKHMVSRGRHYTGYTCKTRKPGHVIKKADQVHEVVDAYMVQLLHQPEVWETVTAERTQESSTWAQEAAGVRARLAEAADGYADGVMTLAQLERISSRLTAKLEDLESHMGANKGGVVKANGKKPEQLWNGATLEQKRAIIRATVRITLARKATRKSVFDYESVQIEPLTT